jgi:hypothetical protein
MSHGEESCDGINWLQMTCDRFGSFMIFGEVLGRLSGSELLRKDSDQWSKLPTSE